MSTGVLIQLFGQTMKWNAYTLTKVLQTISRCLYAEASLELCEEGGTHKIMNLKGNSLMTS
jgi:hypothetical protein